MQGRKPMPTHLHMVLGNPSKKTLPDISKLPSAESPPCPAHLSVRARDEWNRIVPLLLALNLLQQIDMAQLAAYCVVYARWADVEAELLRISEKDPVNGLTVMSPNGYPQVHPLLAVANKCLEQLRNFAGEFGLSPVMRTRVESMMQQRPLFGDDPMETMLRAGSSVTKAA